MKEGELPSWVCTALMRIGTRLATGFDRYFSDAGITQAQFRVLLAIWDEGGADGIAPSVLADHLLIERATVSVLTARMVERGLLERTPGENRRTYRLRLTPQGGGLLHDVIPQAMALADQTLASITPDALRQMQTMLESVESRLRAAPLLTERNSR